MLPEAAGSASLRGGWPHKLQNQYVLAATIQAWPIKALAPGRTRSLQREIPETQDPNPEMFKV